MTPQWVYIYRPSEDHRIRDVRTLKLIKAKHTPRLRHLRSHERYRIKVTPVPHLEHVEFLMDVLHEVVEVDAGFVLNIRREGLVEHVHQHGLSRPNVAVEIEALGGVAWDLDLQGGDGLAAEEGIELYERRYIG